MFARTVSENRNAVLEHDADLAAQRVERDVAHVDAVDADRAVLHVVEAGEEQARPSTCPSPTRRRARRVSPGATCRSKPSSTGSDAQVAEADVLERDLAARPPARSARVGLLGDERVGVEQLEDPLGAGPRLLADGDQARRTCGPARASCTR